MRRSLVLVNALFISLSLCICSVSVSAQGIQKSAMFEQTTSIKVNVLVNKHFSMEELGNYPVLKENNLGELRLLTIQIPNQNVTSVIEQLKKKIGVTYAEQDQTIKKEFTANDPYFPYQWFHETVHTPAAWDETKGNGNITVAVIDGIVDINHPEFKDKIVDPYDVVNHTTAMNSPEDHATHVAGIIAAAMDNGEGGAGIAPGVKIMPINVFNGDYADTSDVIAGINYAINHHANVINMSMGVYDYSYLMNAAIQQAYQHGITVVAAAGNDASNQNSYPAAYNHVISVSSINQSGHHSTFSNYGSTIDLAAPGEEILSTLPGKSYGYMSGTSMASPMVSGVAALILSKNPKLTPDQVAGILYQSADDLGTPGKDIYYGYGEVDAKKALDKTPALVQGEWKVVDNKWSYYENGVMKTGWVNSNASWYYFNNSGIMQTGWQKSGNQWYYLDPQSGKMKTGWLLSNGSWYYFASTGAMVTSWVSLNNNWYYLNSNGEMATGWLNWNGKWYYLQENGTMAKNITIHGYYFGNDGAWIH